MATWVLGLALAAGVSAASVERGGKSDQLTLLVAQREGVIEVLVGEIVLERLPLDDVALLRWQGGGANDGPDRRRIDISSTLVVSGAPAVEVYPTIISMKAPDSPVSSADLVPPAEPAAPAGELKLAKEEARALPRSYDVELAGGGRLEITTGRARPGFMTRWLDGWRYRAALRNGQGPPPDRLVLAVERPVAERLLPMLRAGTRILLGPATGAALPEKQ